MIDQATRRRSTRTALLGAIPTALLLTGVAHAQPAPAEPAPPAAAPAPAPAPTPAPAPAPAAEPAPPPVATAPAPLAPTPPVVESAPVPAPAEEKKPDYKITTGVGVRFGMQYAGYRNGKNMNQLGVDEVYAEPRFSGQVLGFIGWTANLAVSGITNSTAIGRAGGADTPPPNGAPVIFEARAMDLIAQLDFMDEFHIWGGRMLTPSDRSNFSGPWFMSPWDYPGAYGVGGSGAHPGGFRYIGPRGTEEIGREVGTTVWGDIGKGKFKYYAAILDLDDAPTNTPLYSARLGYAILGNEPGFYGSSTYYGAQNIVAIGAAAQYQNRFAPVGSPHPDDVFEFNADLLAEFKVGDGGAVTAEGAYYHVDSGKSAGVMPFDDAGFVVLSYLTPLMGPGKLQPLVRMQAFIDKVDGGPDVKGRIYEGQLAYVLKDYFAKLNIGFQHTDLGKHNAGLGVSKTYGNAIQFGFQIQQ